MTLLIAVLGAVLFACADGFGGVLLGRALIGLGVSACLMAAFKAFVLWFPVERLPLINGWQMGAGGLGAIAATKPVGAAMDVIGWRGIFLAAALMVLLAALLIFLVVPERKGDASVPASLAELWHGSCLVFSSSFFWRVAPMTVCAQAELMAMQGLWLGPWLQDVAGLAHPVVANFLLISATGMVAGFLCLGWAGSRATDFGVGPLP